MKRFFVIAFLVVGSFLVATTGWADGLIYNLPDDGEGVEYVVSGKNLPLGANFLTICSVGRVLCDGEYHRWIETRWSILRGDKPEIMFATKLLIPEKHLGAGHNHLKHIVCALVHSLRFGAGTIEMKNLDADNIQMRQLFPLYLPDLELSELTDKTIETPDGKKKCRGVKGFSETMPGPKGSTLKITQEIYINDDIPFGVVAGIQERVITGSTSNSTETLTLKFKSVIRDAKSVIGEYWWLDNSHDTDDFSGVDSEMFNGASLIHGFHCLAVDFRKRLALVFDVERQNHLSLIELDSGKIFA